MTIKNIDQCLTEGAMLGFMTGTMIGSAIILIFFLAVLVKSCTPQKKGKELSKEAQGFSDFVQPIKILSKDERKMYELLVKAIPDHIVLCQVSFNAFIKCNEISLRNRFNRSMCDFMVVDFEFNPLVCIELDDRSHKKMFERDKFRDDLLGAATIPTERFYGIPEDAKEIKKRIKCHLTYSRH